MSLTRLVNRVKGVWKNKLRKFSTYPKHVTKQKNNHKIGTQVFYFGSAK